MLRGVCCAGTGTLLLRMVAVQPEDTFLEEILAKATKYNITNERLVYEFISERISEAALKALELKAFELEGLQKDNAHALLIKDKDNAHTLALKDSAHKLEVKESAHKIELKDGELELVLPCSSWPEA